MVDYDNMGPSLKLVRARFWNFLFSKLSRDFKGPYSLLLEAIESHGWVYW